MSGGVNRELPFLTKGYPFLTIGGHSLAYCGDVLRSSRIGAFRETLIQEGVPSLPSASYSLFASCQLSGRNGDAVSRS